MNVDKLIQIQNHEKDKIIRKNNVVDFIMQLILKTNPLV
jgi:dimeric dUTPase (all-alpha-NTP-PPase superfamily)